MLFDVIPSGSNTIVASEFGSVWKLANHPKGLQIQVDPPTVLIRIMYSTGCCPLEEHSSWLNHYCCHVFLKILKCSCSCVKCNRPWPSISSSQLPSFVNTGKNVVFYRDCFPNYRTYSRTNHFLQFSCIISPLLSGSRK